MGGRAHGPQRKRVNHLRCGSQGFPSSASSIGLGLAALPIDVLPNLLESLNENRNWRITTRNLNAKCELIAAIEQDINRARENGRRYRLVDVETILHAMQYDQKGGIEELPGILDDIARACHCNYSRHWENHRETITFLFHSGTITCSMLTRVSFMEHRRSE